MKWLTSAALAATLCLTGCSATQARIDKNEDLFNSYPPDQQAMIKSNRIGVGFDSTQVYLALSNADRTGSENGQEVWYYHGTYNKTIQEELSASEYRAAQLEYENAQLQGIDAPPPSTHRVYKLYRTGVERIVRFEDGYVVSWDEPEEMWLDEWHSR